MVRSDDGYEKLPSSIGIVHWMRLPIMVTRYSSSKTKAASNDD